jgi:O-antigen/teichoic acid export membrane protein
MSEGGWIVAGQVASILGMLMLIKVLTERLDPVGYGQLALGLTTLGLVNQIVMGGVVNGISRYYSIAMEDGDIENYKRSSFRLLLIATGVVLVLAVLLGGLLKLLSLDHWISLVAAATVASILSGYNGALNGVQGAARKRSTVAIHSALDAWLKIAFALLAMEWLGKSGSSVVIGFAVSALVVTVSQLLCLRNLQPEASNPPERARIEKWTQSIWTFSWPYSVWGMFAWIQQVSDRWAIEALSNSGDVGKYVVVFQLGYAPMGTLAGLIVALISPILYQRSGGAADAERNDFVHRISWRITQACLFMTFISYLVACALHTFIFEWIVAPGFRNVSNLLPWLVLAGGLFASGQVLGIKLASELRPRSQMNMKIVTAITGGIANIIGAWKFGVEGVVGAVLLYSMFSFLWMARIASSKPKLLQE